MDEHRGKYKFETSDRQYTGMGYEGDGKSFKKMKKIKNYEYFYIRDIKKKKKEEENENRNK